MTTNKLDAYLVMVEEMRECGVISDEMAALYRAKRQACDDACAGHRDLLTQYTRVRAGGTIDDVDRRFAAEALAQVTEAHVQLDSVRLRSTSSYRGHTTRRFRTRSHKNMKNTDNDNDLGNLLTDLWLSCCECGADFLHRTRDRDFFRQRGFSDPKRCRPCRQSA